MTSLPQGKLAAADRMSAVLHSIEFLIRKTRSSRMYLLYILELRVRNVNSLLRGTTDIPVRSDTLRIFRSGMDAAGLNRSDVSAPTETRRQKRTRKYAFDSATQ
ncbi:hypothetical protein GWP43_04965 [Treponema vincentii]|uniref:Uncharacterized protein n=1 Tax=Treponema vincentii TaxID=69710 RepID=A0A6P1Y0Y3_9SPIR|nr:hypothetical protein [Treponema vincentii]QHX42910.1 hypothetical protein GWP43_04965 [Treponema vincentii]